MMNSFPPFGFGNLRRTRLPTFFITTIKGDIATMNKFIAYRKYQLMRSGITENKIAVMLGVSRQSVNKEMLGKKSSRRIREAICRLTRTPEEKLFPELHTDNGGQSCPTT